MGSARYDPSPRIGAAKEKAMGDHVCPRWVGYLLISPLRRWFENPEKMLRPYITDGMTVLDVGPAMGFFTIPAAFLVGDTGRVIAVDIQEEMIESLKKRAATAGVARRVDARLCAPDDIGVSGPIDVCLAFHVVHEVPDAARLFSQLRAVLKPGGKVLLTEPRFHVSLKEFQATLERAREQGFSSGEEGALSARSAVLTSG